MKRTITLLVVVAVSVLVFAPAAMAQYDMGEGGTTASPTATATASPTATATATATASASPTATASPLPKTGGLRRTGGPPLLPAIFGLAIVMVGSGVATLALVRRYTSS